MTRRAQSNNSYGPSQTEKSPERKRREAAARRRQEKRWTSKNGVVTTRYECPLCGGSHPRAECPNA